MARVFSNVIGNLSGKLGNLSARITFGRTILAARPASFNVPSDQAALDRRGTFLSAVKFALQVSNLPALKKIWEKVKPNDLSVFNQVVSTNYTLCSAARPTVDNVITPDGFAMAVQNAVLDADKLTATIPALNTVTELTPEEVHCSINAVICYHSPLNEADEPYSIIRLSKDVPNFEFDTAYSLQMDLNVIQKAVAAKYDSSILYLAVATKTAEEKVIQGSATYVQAF